MSVVYPYDDLWRRTPIISPQSCTICLYHHDVPPSLIDDDADTNESRAQIAMLLVMNQE